MKILKILAGCAALMTACAQGQLMPAFKNVDKDEDGVISLQESKSSGNTTLKNFFAQLDSNKDSEVTTSEFERLKDLVKAANAKKRTMRAAEKKKKGKKGKKGKKRNKR